VCADGHENNRVCLSDCAATVLRWRPEWGVAEEVAVSTSADNWGERTPLVRNSDGVWAVTLALPPATRIEYKFQVDGKWRAEPGAPSAPGSGNCTLRAEHAVPSVTLAYASGWAAPRLLLPPGDGRDAAVEVPLAPAGRGFWRVTLPAAPAGAPALAFTLTDGAAAVDAPPGGGLYRCPHPGAYKLERGRLTPFPCALRPRFMLVTDLDGTLVGDGPEADAATAAFRDYWDGRGRLAGGVLVFNTGRSIGSVMSLLKEKAALMPIPDVIVTAVGTKIFRRRIRTDPRAPQTPLLRPRGAPLSAEASGTPMPPAWDESSWEMDADWCTLLDEGWRLEAAQGAAQAVIEAMAGSTHWLDRGTEHPHRVSLAVRAEALEGACSRLRQGLADASCRAKIIVSGNGEWRYVDAVAPLAGKYAATEAVARTAGVPLARTLAAGDSGNDLDMLGGRCYAVVVGNAQPDLAAWALAQRQDGRIVNASAYTAAGVLEGLARVGLY
jgi:hydroxymethylpyrimidine pyrophosphatase-like HAD family hydrolase